MGVRTLTTSGAAVGNASPASDVVNSVGVFIEPTVGAPRLEVTMDEANWRIVAVTEITAITHPITLAGATTKIYFAPLCGKKFRIANSTTVQASALVHPVDKAPTL